MRPLRRVQRDLYLASRTAGDLDAAQRGPNVLARRLMRRSLTRFLFQTIRKASR